MKLNWGCGDRGACLMRKCSGLTNHCAANGRDPCALTVPAHAEKGARAAICRLAVNTYNPSYNCDCIPLNYVDLLWRLIQTNTPES